MLYLVNGNVSIIYYLGETVSEEVIHIVEVDCEKELKKQ